MSQITITRRTPYADLPDWLKIREVAAYLGLTSNTIYQWCHTGKLKFIRDGKIFLIHKVQLHPDRERVAEPIWELPQERDRVVRALAKDILREARERAAVTP